MADVVKRLNRNAFNEKLLHRFYLESLYSDDLTRRAKLLPADLRGSAGALNLVVPEESAPRYRPDFRLYFSGRANAVPVEIKWSAKSFTKPNQVDAIRKGGGFLAAFDEPGVGVRHVILDEADFRSWLVSRIDTLWDEAFSANVHFTPRDGKWLVALKGPEALGHFAAMLDKCGPRRAFWAFKNRHGLMPNLLGVRTGDRMVFLELRVSGGFTAIPLARNVTATVLRAHFGLVREPYYMVMKGPKATFFDDTTDIATRLWPHYIDLEISEQTTSASFNSRNIPASLWQKIAQSHNKGTLPLPLLQNEWEGLLRLLPPRRRAG